MRIFFFVFNIFSLRLICTWCLSHESQSLTDTETRIETNGNIVTKSEQRIPLKDFSDRKQIDPTTFNETMLSNNTIIPPVGDPFMDLFKLLKPSAVDTSAMQSALSSTRVRNLQQLSTTNQQVTNDPMRVVDSHHSVFFTHHSDSKCKNPYYDTSIPSYVNKEGVKERLKINVCLNQQNFNTKYACKIGKNKYSLFKKVFAQSDATCSVPLSTQKIIIHKHDYVCGLDKSGNTAGYMQIHCGEDSLLENTMPAMPYLSFPEVYSNPTCSDTGLKSADPDTPPRTQRRWLDICTAQHTSRNGSVAVNFTPFLLHHYTLSVVSESPLKIKYSRFASNDPQCSVKKHEHIYTYPEASNPAAMPACLSDPQFPEYYYLNSLATKPQIMPKEPEPEPELTEQYQYLQVKKHATSDFNCSRTPEDIHYETLGVCKRQYLNFFETGRSLKEIATNTSLLLYTYNQTDCTGPYAIESRPLASLGAEVMGVCMLSGESSLVYELMSILPDSRIHGSMQYYFGSNPDDCEKGKKWTAAAVQPLDSSCKCIMGRFTVNWDGREAIYPKFVKQECSSDGASVVVNEYYEPTCTKPIATATFYADTNGTESTEYIIRNLECISWKTKKPCDATNRELMVISGKGPGAGGIISYDMVLTWEGMPPHPPVTSGWCRFNFTNSDASTDSERIAVCSTGVSILIPNNTLITARSRMMNTQNGNQQFHSTQCVISKQYYYSATANIWPPQTYSAPTDDAQFYSRGRCGNFKLTDKMAATTFPEGQKYFAPTTGYLASSGIFDCTSGPSYTSVEKFGQCIRDTSGTGSYRKLIGSNVIETQTYSTTPNCTGSYVPSRNGLNGMGRRSYFTSEFPGFSACSPGFYNPTSLYDRTMFRFAKSLSAFPEVSTLNNAGLGFFYSSNSTCTLKQSVSEIMVTHIEGCYLNEQKRNHDGDTNRGWLYSFYTGTKCSADRTQARNRMYADSSCTTPNATATFIADTNGTLSTTLVIRGVRTAHMDNLSRRFYPGREGFYPGRENGFGTIISTVIGTSGGIQEGMSLSWAGKDPTVAVTLVEGTCVYYWANMYSTDADTASCTLSSPMSIPTNTLVTGKYTYPNTTQWTLILGNNQCHANSWSYGTKYQNWSHEFCGSSADLFDF